MQTRIFNSCVSVLKYVYIQIFTVHLLKIHTLLFISIMTNSLNIANTNEDKIILSGDLNVDNYLKKQKLLMDF